MILSNTKKHNEVIASSHWKNQVIVISKYQFIVIYGALFTKRTLSLQFNEVLPVKAPIHSNVMESVHRKDLVIVISGRRYTENT